MLVFVLFLLSCRVDEKMFPGYLPIPSPTVEDQVIIPIPAEKPEFDFDPILKA